MDDVFNLAAKVRLLYDFLCAFLCKKCNDVGKNGTSSVRYGPFTLNKPKIMLFPLENIRILVSFAG